MVNGLLRIGLLNAFRFIFAEKLEYTREKEEGMSKKLNPMNVMERQRKGRLYETNKGRSAVEKDSQS